jgi:sterol desaturase/sphingolipid hydroxylase (fatty acid hydroxylase superfamily)
MDELVIAYEAAIRMSFFLGVFALMAFLEVLSPRRRPVLSKMLRWGNNLGLVIFNSILLRFIFPAAAVGVAALASEQGWGLLNYYSLPLWVSLAISLLVMDFVIYLQHILMHAVPILWRLHRVHHADLDYDVTTGARFHPIEIILSMLIKFVTIVALGPTIVAVVIFEIVLNAMAMFNHANVRLPLRMDHVLRQLIVTPDMHRVHHSVDYDEANSNFGFNLAFWDRWFGTYRDQPRAGHEQMIIGIQNYRTPGEVTWIHGILWLPFRGTVGNYAINRSRSLKEE